MLSEDVVRVLLCKIELTPETLVKLVITFLSRDLMNQFVIRPYLHILRHFMITLKPPPLATLSKRFSHDGRAHL